MRSHIYTGQYFERRPMVVGLNDHDSEDINCLKFLMEIRLFMGECPSDFPVARRHHEARHS